MKIIRNKYLTKISSGMTELQLPTEKFDDIIGVIDGREPEAEEWCSEISTQWSRNMVDFNGKLLTFEKLLEFSDMRRKLYVGSILNSSVMFDSEEQFRETKIKLFLYRLLASLLNVHESEEMLENSIIQYQARDGNIVSEAKSELFTARCARDVDNAIHLMSRWSATKKSMKVLNISKYSTDMAGSLYVGYNRIIENTYLLDESGTKWYFSPITPEDAISVVQDAIIRELYGNGKHKTTPDTVIIMNSLKGLILKLPTWKYFQSGTLLLWSFKHGEKYVEWRTLMDEQTYKLWNTCRRKVLKVNTKMKKKDSLMDTYNRLYGQRVGIDPATIVDTGDQQLRGTPFFQAPPTMQWGTWTTNATPTMQVVDTTEGYQYIDPPIFV